MMKNLVKSIMTVAILTIICIDLSAQVVDQVTVTEVQKIDLRKKYADYYLDRDLNQDSIAKLEVWIDRQMESIIDNKTYEAKKSFIEYQQELRSSDFSIEDNISRNNSNLDSGDEEVTVDKGIAIIARSENGNNLIRWAPQSAQLWFEALRVGYSIRRYELDEGGIIIASTLNQLIPVDDPIMPWDSIAFANYPDRNDSMIMLAAQTMYGSSFKVSGDDEVTNFYGRAQEFENRHGFALFAADRSRSAAEALGLIYEDSDVLEGKNYGYFISAKEGEELLGSGYNNVEAKTDDSDQEAIMGLAIEPGDHILNIRWNKVQDSYYSGYFVERSVDEGITYVRLNESPLVFADNEHNDQSNDIIYIDSVQQNYKNYVYRIRALTPFGDYSRYSSVSGMAIDLKAPKNPYFLDFKLLDDQRVELNWAKDELEDDLAGFHLYKSSSHSGIYTKLFEDPFSRMTYQYTTESLDETETHYYKVAAIDTAGNESESFPIFANVPDISPPSPPVNLIYAIDSTGIVTIGWDLGAEKDLAGYRIYFSNDLLNEFSQITVSPITKNYFIDTIQLKTLTENVYYQVQAVDKRYNRSTLSAPLLVKRPDIVPPVTPVFDQPEISDSTIMLKWHPSSSDDVESHLLFRRKNFSDDVWELIATLGRAADSYSDREIMPEQVYEYALQAQDDDGLLSDLSFPVKGRIYYSKTIQNASNLAARFNEEDRNVQLEWTFSPPSDELLSSLKYRFNIYRSVNEGPLKRLVQFSGNSYIDKKIPKEGSYKYSIQVIYENGKKSAKSELLEVEIPELK